MSYKHRAEQAQPESSAYSLANKKSQGQKLGAVLLATLPMFAVVGAAAALSGCGFQLRGTGDVQFALKELDVSARNAYGETVNQVREVLQNNDVKVYPGAQYRLVLSNEQENRRAASFTSSARTAEYELSKTLEYEIRGSKDLLLMSDKLEAQSFYTQDGNNLIGGDQEAAQLQQEMNRELVQQLVEMVIVYRAVIALAGMLLQQVGELVGAGMGQQIQHRYFAAKVTPAAYLTGGQPAGGGFRGLFRHHHPHAIGNQVNLVPVVVAMIGGPPGPGAAQQVSMGPCLAQPVAVAGPECVAGGVAH